VVHQVIDAKPNMHKFRAPGAFDQQSSNVHAVQAKAGTNLYNRVFLDKEQPYCWVVC